jgi:predicted nucleic acid-binding protein
MIYVDTSVVVALLTVEPSTQAIKDWYAGLEELLVCSDWLLPEVFSAVSIKVRTGQITEAAAGTVRKEFQRFAEGDLRVVPVSRAAFRKAMDLVSVSRHGLRAADALHLAVALELEAGHMATLDTTLAENAKRNGIKAVKFNP